MKTETANLTEGIVWKKLLGFFFPILFGYLFQQLYNIADAVIVGRFVGDSAFAAVGGSASTITNLIIGFFTGLATGATVIISQRFGSDDRQGLSDILHSWTTFSLIIGVLLTLLLWFAAPAMLRFVNNPEDIMADSTLYLRIYSLGSVPLLLYNLFQGTLQAVGDSRRPLIYLITSCIMNIFLDLLFVAVFKWGVAGVGWASVLSMAVCTLMALLHLLRTSGPHKLHLSRLTLNLHILAPAMKIGLPAGLQGTMYSISNLIITTAVNGFGTPVIAAWTATGKLDGFYWVTTNAFGTAICAFVGQCYGAGKISRMKQSIRTCLVISISVTAVLAFVLLTCAQYIYPIFLSEQSVIDDAIRIMMYIVPFYVVWSYIEVMSGTFRGVGDTFMPMIIVMLGTCIFRVLWMFIVVPKWHTLMGISVIYGISWILTSIAFTVYYFKGNWLRGKI